jgi:hypothetical protein
MKCQHCGDTKWIGGDERPDCAKNLAPEPARPSEGSVTCSDLVGDTAGQTLNRPTAAGWWWTRPDASCLWRIVEITIGHDGRLWVQDMGDEEPDVLLGGLDWWEWAGPLVPPVSPTAIGEARADNASPPKPPTL